MTTRARMLLVLLALGGCASAPEPAAVADKTEPGFCRTAYEAGPSYTRADRAARAAERQAAMPEGVEVAPLIALDRTGPHYPQCGLSYGLEGECDVLFDVLPDGTTANILPVCTNRIFERDAAYAVSRWTFQPPGDGPRPAVVNRLSFRLGDPEDGPAPALAGTATE